MCGIQAGFDGKSLLPLNFRSLSGASPLPPHPPFPLFLRPTSTLRREQSLCTRTLRVGAPPPPPQGTRLHSVPQDSLLHQYWGPYSILLALPPSQPIQHTATQSSLGPSRSVLRCASRLLPRWASFPLGLATSSCVARPASASSSLCSPCPGSDYISPHV